MKKTLFILFGALVMIACKSHHVNVEPANCDTMTAVNQVSQLKSK